MAMWVITFPSVAHAFRAKKLLENAAISCKLIPIPRSLSASCEGLAARIDEPDVARASALLADNSVVMLLPGVRVSDNF